MLTQDYSVSKVGFACIWTVKEKQNGIYVPVLRRKNVITDYGLSSLAAAWNGTAIPPLYIILETLKTTVSASTIIGATSIQLAARVDQTGDTKIQLSIGTANEETATFSSVTGTGPYTYTVTALTKAHTAADKCARAPQQSDTMTKVTSELSYDLNTPNTRAPITASYSVSTGVYTYQFFFTGIQANGYLMSVGLADNANFAAGNLFAHLILNYDHTFVTTGSDVEIDATLTATNV